MPGPRYTKYKIIYIENNKSGGTQEEKGGIQRRERGKSEKTEVKHKETGRSGGKRGKRMEQGKGRSPTYRRGSYIYSRYEFSSS